LLRRRTRLTTHRELARPHTPERHGDNHGGLDVLGIRGYVVCGGDVVATRTYPHRSVFGGTVRVT
jgi:hypothetical protein